MSWQDVDALLATMEGRRWSRRLVGLIGIGGRTAGLALAESPKYEPKSVHLRWQAESLWGYPGRGFRLYRRRSEDCRNRFRREVEIPHTPSLPTIPHPPRSGLGRVDLARPLGRPERRPPFSGGARRLDDPYVYALDEPVREVQLRFATGSRRVKVEGWDQDRRTLSADLGYVRAGQRVRLPPVVDRIRLSVPVSRLESIAYTPMAPDLLQWPEGSLSTWGDPIARFHLPRPDQIDEAAALLRAYQIDPGLDPNEFREVYAQLIEDLREEPSPAGLLAGGVGPLDRWLRGRPWGDIPGDQLRMRPLDMVALMSVHPALAEFLGFYYRDDLAKDKEKEEFDYLIVADWGRGLLASAPDYGLSADTSWPITSPAVEVLAVTRRAFPAPYGGAAGQRRYRLQVELSLAHDAGVVERERAPYYTVTRDGARLGDGPPTPCSEEGRTFRDAVDAPGTYAYAVVGVDLFGRQAPSSAARSLVVSDSDWPAPSAPVRIAAAWEPGAGAYQVRWLWTQELRDLHPGVDRFQVLAGVPDTETNDQAVATALARALVPVQISAAGGTTLAGRLAAPPQVVPLPDRDDKFDPASEATAATWKRLEDIAGPGAGLVRIATDLELADSAGAFFLAADRQVSLTIEHAAAWQTFPIVEHTLGPGVTWTIAAPQGYPWASYTGNERYALKFNTGELASLWRLAGGAVAGAAEGTLGDATGRSFIVLAADTSGTLVVLNRTANGGLPPTPARGDATLALPQSVEIGAALVAGPTFAQPVRQIAFRVMALEAGTRRGAKSGPAVVTRILEVVPPAASQPSALLSSLPDLEQKTRVIVTWGSAGDGYGYEVLRTSERHVQMRLMRQPLPGVDRTLIPRMPDDELVALLSPAAGGGASPLDRAFQLAGTVPAGQTRFEDTLDSAGLRFLYAVRAVDRAGNRGPLSRASTPVLPPDLRPPVPPQATRAYWDGGSAWVSWAVPSNDRADRYRLFRSPDKFPAPPYLLQPVAGGAAPETEPLIVRGGRIPLPLPEGAQYTAVLGLDAGGAPDPAADLSAWAIPTGAGSELQPLWANGMRILLEATLADGTTLLRGTGGETISVEAGRVALPNDVPAGAAWTGVFPLHLASVAGSALTNRSALPNLCDHGYLDPAAPALLSLAAEGTRWLLELTTTDGTVQKLYLDLLEVARQSPIELRDGAIALPFWDAGRAALSGLYLWAETEGGDGTTPRRPAAWARNLLDRFELDSAHACLRPRWREGLHVAVRCLLADGSERLVLADPARLRLRDAVPPDAAEWYYFVQAGREVEGTPIWSALSGAIPHQAAAPDRPVWREAAWDASSAQLRLRLAFRAGGPGAFRLDRRPAGSTAWSRVLELRWEESSLAGELFERADPSDPWVASAAWSRDGDAITGRVTDVDPAAACDYRAGRLPPAQGTEALWSLILRMAPFFGAE